MKLFLIRHGETLWNVEERCQGFSDIELNDTGLRQARAVALALKDEPLDAVYASPLQRALITAQQIANLHGLEVIPDAGLMEVNQGDFEGLTTAELRQHEAFLREWFLHPANLCMPNGESLAEAQTRAWGAIDRMRAAHPDGTVAAVGHNLTNVTILCRALGLDLDHFRRLRQSVAAISTLEIGERGCTLTSLNQVWHLEGGNLDANKAWYREEHLQKTVDALTKHGFHASWVATAAEARQRVLEMIPAGARVGTGGSSTIRQIGLVEEFNARGHEVFDHWKAGLSPADQVAARRGQMSADVFLASSNAVTESGELVNIDGTGNRVNSMIFGPGKVILVAGINKIVPDVSQALWRVKNVAAPMNAKRLGLKVPCATTGRCTECDSPGRQCRVTTIIERKPSLTDFHVLLVNEELGF